MLSKTAALILIGLVNVDQLEERKVVALVNDYVNTYTFIPDNVDEWYTLTEFVSRGGGDCEDFAIAKYTLLVALGIPKRSLKMTYGFNIPQREKHMVLIYTDKTTGNHLILDNINKDVVPIDNPDFLAYFFFDDTSMYLRNKNTGTFKRVSSVLNLPKWVEILQSTTSTDVKG